MSIKLLFRQDLILAALLVTVIILMIIPLPNFLIDSLIAFNITLSVLLLMVGIYLRHPSDLSTFPSIILVGTAFRLAISIATTRAILTEADAGQIIETFGKFVISGSIIVGLVIFLIITIVQFIVITKGSERVAEVAARFCLDAMPGKQMSIDAELRAGTIEQEEANERRQKLDKDNQFFGAMDGAMKFVKGDAIAGLIITAVNLLGGIAVGMIVHDYSVGQSVTIYSLLTIGDGLVAQIPALFMSMCAAIIITRVTHSENQDLGSEIATQLAADRRALFVAAAVIIGLGLIPGFPWLIFMVIAATLILIGFMLKPQQDEEEESDAIQEQKSVQLEAKKQELAPAHKDAEIIDAEADVGVRETDRLKLIVGSALFDVMKRDNSSAFRDQLYKKWHNECGVAFPVFQIEQDQTTEPWDMRIEFDHVPAAKYKIPENSVFLIADPEIRELLPDGTKMTPISWTGKVGFWVNQTSAETIPEIEGQAISAGHAAVEATFMLGKRFSGQMFSRVELGYFISEIEEKDPNMVKEIADTLGVSVLQDILKRLVEESVPLKPARLLMETLYQMMAKTKNPLALAEAARLSLKRQICHSLADDNNIIAAVVLEPGIEKSMRQSAQTATNQEGIADKSIVVEPKISEKILNKFYSLQTARPDRGRTLVVVTSPDIRRPLRNFLHTNNVFWPVISFQEISSEVKAQPVAMIKLQETGMNQPKQAA